MHGGSAAFASVVRNASRGVGRAIPRYTGERLQRSKDIAKQGVGKVGGEEEGKSGEQRGPDGCNHRVPCLQANAGGLGLG